MLRVLYDISVLGFGHAEPRDRTGVFRAVESLAYALRARRECEVHFTAIQNFLGAQSYLQTDWRMQGDHLTDHRSFAQRFLDENLVGLNTAIYDAKGIRHWGLRGERKLLYHLSTVLQYFFEPIAPEDVARAQIFHSPFNALPAQVKRAVQLKRFLTVYDLSPILYPRFFESIRAGFFANILTSLGKSDWVFCISQFTKNELCGYLKTDPAHIFVTHLAANPRLFFPCADAGRHELVRQKYHIPDAPYILSLSALEPRKNVDHVIRSFVQLLQAEHIPDLNLVLAGPRVRLYTKILNAIRKYPELQSRIILTGYVGDADLASLYSGALAFVCLSLYEGFGLPPLEAMQCGVPVITSNTSSFPEVVGDAGFMLDPTDVSALSQSLLDIYSSPTLRASMAMKSLKRAEQFSWEECSRQTILGYRTALESGES